jgi:hypothetical protein
MSPLSLAAIGGAVTAGLLLVTRKAKAATAAAPAPVTPAVVQPQPPKIYGETTRVPLAVPAGWRRVGPSEVTPDLIAQANSLRSSTGFTSLPYGTLRPFTSDGRTYATWVEQHYHEPGGAAKPWGYHHGVTLLARKDAGVFP